MKKLMIAALAASPLALGGAVFALQDDDNGRDPGERQAMTGIAVHEDDEISLSYNTIRYSDNPIKMMKEDPEARQQWARFIPQLLGAELTSDVDLSWRSPGGRDYNLPAGTYGLSFAMNDESGWDLVLMAGDRARGRLPLGVKQCDLRFEYLTMNLMSAGAHNFHLMVGYGSYATMIEFATATHAEDQDG